MKIIRRLHKEYFRQSLVCIIACCLFLNMSLPVAQATPAAANVVAGSAAIVQNGNTIDVQMISSRAVINWDSLDTSYNETLNFLKESNFAVLNRVINGGLTQFDGSLFAENGSVFIVNTQGIVFGPTAYIRAKQFVGSSLDIRNTDFMNGQYAFAGGNGAVVNHGDITAESVALIGKKVLNAGTITSPEGYVVMAAGDRVLLGQPGESVFVEVDSAGIPEPMDTKISDVPADVTNEGLINAEGGTIVLAAGDTFSMAVANIGTLATAAGKVTLNAARVENRGTINADAVDGDGGSISLTATEEVVLGAGSLTTANAGANGDGGKVIVQSEGTAILSKGSLIEAKGGSESGNGGFVEISGDHFVFAGDVDASAANGKFGTLLIDPDNIVVKDGDGTNTTDTLYEEQLETQLADIFLLAVESIIMEDLIDNELDADTRNVTFQTTGTDSFISFHESDTISTTTGNIVIESGGGGINIGNLETGKAGGRDKVPSGKIIVTTDNGGDIITRDLHIRSGWGSGEIDVDASGSLTIDGDVSVGKKGAAILNVPNGADAQATIRLSAGEDVVLNGDVGAYSHGKEDSLPGGVTTAEVRIYAGTNDEPTSGDVFINGDLTAMAKASKNGTSEATIEVDAWGNIEFGPKAAKPLADADKAHVESYESAIDTDGEDTAEIIINAAGNSDDGDGNGDDDNGDDDDGDDDDGDDNGDDDGDGDGDGDTTTTQAAPIGEKVELAISGCPALMKWAADELGIDERTLKIWETITLAFDMDIQPCKACARLKDTATILQDTERTYIAALAQAVNQFAPVTAPPSEEQMASIADAIARHGDDNTYYTAAGQWLDALVEYVGILSTGMGWSLDEAVALVIDKYIAPATEGADANLDAFIAMRLAALAG